MHRNVKCGAWMKCTDGKQSHARVLQIVFASYYKAKNMLYNIVSLPLYNFIPSNSTYLLLKRLYNLYAMLNAHH